MRLTIFLSLIAVTAAAALPVSEDVEATPDWRRTSPDWRRTSPDWRRTSPDWRREVDEHNDSAIRRSEAEVLGGTN
ncbi:hypothetical protein Ac2012v2_000280 [Leucoagaricus gongylophorus]